MKDTPEWLHKTAMTRRGAANLSNLLLLAYYFPPENTSGATRPAYFCRYLPEFGYQPTVITRSDIPEAPPSSASVRRAPSTSVPGTGLRLAGWAAHCIERYLLPYNERLLWVPSAVSQASSFLKTAGQPVLLSTSPPVATHFAALTLKRKHNLKWIADFQDPLWGNPFRTRPFAHHYDRALERLIFKSADAVIANTDSVGQLWRRRYPQWQHKIHVITNGYDPQDRISPSRALQSDRRVIAHVGAIYGGRRPQVILACLDRLIENGRLDPGAVCVRFVGPMDAQCAGVDTPLFSRLRDRGCIECVGSLPTSRAREEMANASHLLLLDLNDMGAGLQIPAKLYDYIRVGRPILAFTSQDSPTDVVLQRSGIPYACVDPAWPCDRIDRSVLPFLSLPSGYTKAAPWFWSTFDARSHSRRLAAILDQLAPQRPEWREAMEGVLR
jgi:glycosyltransferase involved in cell wall biosynthesis